MNRNKFSFESEKLVVDYISFNIKGSVNLQTIRNYLFQNFGFNSTFFKKFNTKYKFEFLN